MTEQLIIVTVNPAGDVSIKTQGFAGDTCRTATRSLEAALGLRSRETLTAEAYAAAEASAAVKQRG